jgi:hypothetical protein
MVAKSPVATILLASCVGLFFATSARAGGPCDDPKIVERLPSLPNGCQKESISSSGNQRPTQMWASNSAEEHWRDQVLNKYGERFARWSNAACAKTECAPSSLAGFTRCTYSGYPCATKPYFDEALTRREIREMQRLLTRNGYSTKVDGLFGEKTHQALQRWQRSRNLPDEGLPTREAFDALRQA